MIQSSCLCRVLTDINECDYSEIADKCEHGCINTPGSHHCADADELVRTIECPQGLIPTEDNLSCQGKNNID